VKLAATARPDLKVIAVVTRERKIVSNYYFGLRRCPSGMILFQRVKTCLNLKLSQNYFAGLLQLMSIFQHVQYRQNAFEIIP